MKKIFLSASLFMLAIQFSNGQALNNNVTSDYIGKWGGHSSNLGLFYHGRLINDDYNKMTSYGIYRSHGGTNTPSGFDHTTALNIGTSGDGARYGFQLSSDTNTNSPKIAFRTFTEAGTYSSWSKILHENNFNSFFAGLSSVGIGTTSPQHLLDIVGEEGAVELRSTDDEKWTYFTVANSSGKKNHFGISPGDDGYGHIGTTSAIDFHIRTSNKRRATFLANGNVGIGTTSPDAKLEIKRSETIGGFWNPNESSLTVTSDGGTMILDSNEIYSNGNNFYIGTYGGGDIKFRGAGSTKGSSIDKMTIKNSGNIGIGTDEPDAKLEIKDNGTIAGKWNPDNSYLTLTDGGYSMIFDPNEIYSNGNTLNIGTSGGNINFRNVNTDGDVNDIMTLKNNGNVGIGIVPNNKYKLSVNGTIWATEVKISLTQAADWVFDDSYSLRPLSEVASYIKENKHLPEIPSAEEFRENDLKVSEMTNKLLQKIEELTLYTIEQEEKIKQQEKEIKLQREKEIEVEERLLKIEKLLNQK